MAHWILAAAIGLFYMAATLVLAGIVVFALECLRASKNSHIILGDLTITQINAIGWSIVGAFILVIAALVGNAVLAARETK